jgi:hypothetical protein
MILGKVLMTDRHYQCINTLHFHSVLGQMMIG